MGCIARARAIAAEDRLGPLLARARRAEQQLKERLALAAEAAARRLAAVEAERDRLASSLVSANRDLDESRASLRAERDRGESAEARVAELLEREEEAIDSILERVAADIKDQVRRARLETEEAIRGVLDPEQRRRYDAARGR